MAQKISILLLEDIASLGRAGDIVEVADVYAKNALFPQGKAVIATSQVKKHKTESEEKKRKQAEEELLAMQAIAERMENTELTIFVSVNEDNEPYGAISAKTIIGLLKDESKIAVPIKKLVGPFPIKALGSFPVTVQLGQGVEFAFVVVVHKKDE